PQTGWPPTNRSGSRADQSFVEPMSVTVARSPVRASTSWTSVGRTVTGAATTARSASASTSSRSPASSTAPRSTATAAAASAGSCPTTRSTPARLAARPTDAPIRPVPTTARFMSPDLFAHQGNERAHLVGERAELRGRDLLRPVAERLLGPRVRLDDDPVGADGDRGA